MFTVIEKKSELQKLQERFEAELKRNLAESMKAKISFQGGVNEHKLYHNGRIYFAKELAHNRYWNAFGLEPDGKNNNSIVVEVNIPKEGINRRIGGVFAKDEYGHAYLLHRGKIGGGREGVGKGEFLNFFRGNMVEIKDGDRTNLACLIAVFSDKEFIENVTFFIKEVYRFKEKVKEGSSGNAKDFSKFTPEFRGNKAGGGRRHVAECNHGRIVDCLQKWVAEAVDPSMIGNNQRIDLAVVSDNTLREVYEVKTGNDLQSIYTAIGQVMYHAHFADQKKAAKMSIVLPKLRGGKLEELQGVLSKLKIRLIKYSKEGKIYKFNSGSK